MENNQGKIDYSFVPVPDWLKDMLTITKLSGRENRIIWVIIGLTYGYIDNYLTGKRQEFAPIGEAYIAKVIGIYESNSCTLISRLIARKIIVESEKGLKINEHVECWLDKDLSKTIISSQPTISNSITKLIENNKNNLSKMISIKDNRNIIKDASNQKKQTPEGRLRARAEIEKIKEQIQNNGIGSLKESYKTKDQ